MMNKLLNSPTVAMLRAKFEALPSRDQRALAILTIALVIGAGYFGVLYPVQNWHKEATQDYQETVDDYHWLVAKAPTVKALNSTAQPPENGTQSLSTIVSQAANSHRIQLANLESLSADRVQFRVQNTAMESIMVMLGGLALTSGVEISQVSIERSGQAGVVNANINLSR